MLSNPDRYGPRAVARSAEDRGLRQRKKRSTVASHWNQSPDACWRCGKDDGRHEICHIVDRCYGGSDDPGNLWILCVGCHDDMPSASAGQELRQLVWLRLPYIDYLHTLCFRAMNIARDQRWTYQQWTHAHQDFSHPAWHEFRTYQSDYATQCLHGIDRSSVYELAEALLTHWAVDL